MFIYRVIKYERSVPIMRGAEKNILSLMGGETQGTPNKMNSRHNNSNHSYNLRNWVISKNH